MHAAQSSASEFVEKDSKVKDRSTARRIVEAIARGCGAAWANRTASSIRQMRVIETLALGPKKQLTLISCNGENYLVGSGADSVQTIVHIATTRRQEQQ